MSRRRAFRRQGAMIVPMRGRLWGPSTRFVPTFKKRKRWGDSAGHRMEKKSLEVTQAEVSVDIGSAFVLLLSGISQGVDINERIGNVAAAAVVQAKVCFNPLAVGPSEPACYCIDLIYDQQVNGALPAITDIFESANPLAFRNLDKRYRFRTIWSSGVFSLNGGNRTVTTGGSNNTASFDVHKKINLRMLYNGVGGTIGAVDHGGIFFVARSSATALKGHVLQGEFRLRFVDGPTAMGRKYGRLTDKSKVPTSSIK